MMNKFGFLFLFAFVFYFKLVDSSRIQNVKNNATGDHFSYDDDDEQYDDDDALDRTENVNSEHPNDPLGNKLDVEATNLVSTNDGNSVSSRPNETLTTPKTVLLVGTKKTGNTTKLVDANKNDEYYAYDDYKDNLDGENGLSKSDEDYYHLTDEKNKSVQTSTTASPSVSTMQVPNSEEPKISTNSTTGTTTTTRTTIFESTTSSMSASTSTSKSTMLSTSSNTTSQADLNKQVEPIENYDDANEEYLLEDESIDDYSEDYNEKLNGEIQEHDANDQSNSRSNDTNVKKLNGSVEIQNENKGNTTMDSIDETHGIDDYDDDVIDSDEDDESLEEDIYISEIDNKQEKTKDNQENGVVEDYDSDDDNNAKLPPAVDMHNNDVNTPNINTNTVDSANKKFDPTYPKVKPSVFSLHELLRSPAVLAGILGGLIVGIVTALLLIFAIIYRMKRKDEGAYLVAQNNDNGGTFNYAYMKAPTKEFYA